MLAAEMLFTQLLKCTAQMTNESSYTKHGVSSVARRGTCREIVQHGSRPKIPSDRDRDSGCVVPLSSRRGSVLEV